MRKTNINATNRLVLHAETIKRLSISQLDEVIGGTAARGAISTMPFICGVQRSETCETK